MKWNGRWRTWTLGVCLGLSTGCAHTSVQQLAERMNPRASVEDFDSELSLARLSERHGQEEQAKKIYEAIARQDKHNVTAHHRLAILASQSRDIQTANKHFRLAEESGEPTASLLSDLGYHLYLTEQLPEAEQKLRQALSLDSQYKAARINLGVVLGEQGRFDEALEEFKRGGTVAEAHANLAYVYSMLGDVKASENEYHLALSMDPELRSAAEALVQLAGRKQGLASKQLAMKRSRATRGIQEDTLAQGPISDQTMEPPAKSDEGFVNQAESQLAAAMADPDAPITLPIPSAAMASIEDAGEQGIRHTLTALEAPMSVPSPQMPSNNVAPVTANLSTADDGSATIGRAVYSHDGIPQPAIPGTGGFTAQLSDVPDAAPNFLHTPFAPPIISPEDVKGE